MLRRSILLCTVLALACGEQFKPATLVDGLRVLGIRSDPADLRPGETSQLRALAVDPSRPPSQRTLLWVSCAPDPFNLGRSACSDIAELQDLSQLTSGNSADLPPGMAFAGLGETASYTAAADLFAALPAEDARRLTGTVAQILLLAVGESVSPLATPEEFQALFTRIQNQEVPFLASLFRVRISEETARNTNPVLGAVSVNGALLEKDARIRFVPGEKNVLSWEAPAPSFERYVQDTPEGPTEKEERLIAAYYATSGRFSEERLSIGSETVQGYTPAVEGDADEPLPSNRRGTLWTVVRDTRGGQVWTELPFFVCDPGLPEPQVSVVSPLTGGAGTRIRLEGMDLGSVLDVVIGGKALLVPEFSSGLSQWEATLPELAAGTYTLIVHSKTCANVDTAGSFVVP